MVLVDTSVWIDHLRKGDSRLETLLGEGSVLCHPFVAGELACGHLRNRREVLSLLTDLPRVRVAGHEEVLEFVSARDLAGKGLGWIHVHLLASALLTRCQLWTRDKALGRAARVMGLTI